MLELRYDDGESFADRTDGLATILYKASAVVQTRIAAAQLRDEPPDFLIAPEPFDIGLFEVHRAAERLRSGDERHASRSPI